MEFCVQYSKLTQDFYCVEWQTFRCRRGSERGNEIFQSLELWWIWNTKRKSMEFYGDISNSTKWFFKSFGERCFDLLWLPLLFTSLYGLPDSQVKIFWKWIFCLFRFCLNSSDWRNSISREATSFQGRFTFTVGCPQKWPPALASHLTARISGVLMSQFMKS